MVDDRPEETGSPPDQERPKRAPPTIDLEATDVGEKQWVLKTALLKGHFEWPSLTLSSASARLEDGSALEAKGRVNLERQEIEEGQQARKQAGDPDARQRIGDQRAANP